MDHVSSFLSNLENIIAVEPNSARDDGEVIPINTQVHTTSTKPSNQRMNSMGTITTETHPSPSTGDKKAKRNSSTFSIAPTSSQLTDKLFEKIISMALPTSTSPIVNKNYVADRIIMQKQRPPLSVQTMSKNCIQLNQRLSVPFELIDEIIKIFSWNKPTYTIGILMLFTHVTLNPYLICSFPFFYICFSVMVPSYSVRHPPETNECLQVNPNPSIGPPINDIDLPKPVPELSREFILNLTDLQNHVMIYIVVYDFINSLAAGFAYWVNESNSSFFYLIFLSAGLTNLIVLPHLVVFIPVKAILLTFGWGFLFCFHPNFRNQLLEFIYSEETRLRILSKSNKLEELILSNFEYYEPQEQREVEIFELQKLDQVTKQWELVSYSKDFYTINSTDRENNKLPQGSLFLNNIKPPVDWEYIQRNWKLDLNPSNWVQENLLFDLVNIDSDEKWVYDVTNDDNHIETYPKHDADPGFETETTNDNYDNHDENEDGDNLAIDLISGIYRRRRWIRVCSRAFNIKTSDDDSNSIKSNASNEDLKKLDTNSSINSYAIF